MNIHIQAIKTKAVRDGRLVAGEAIGLLRRRKLSYAALALALTAGSLYLSGVRPALVTSGGQISKSTADDSGTSRNQSEPLQAATGQDVTQPDDNTLAQDGAAASQSHTSVTVNGSDIPLPANGSVQKTMSDSGSSTSVSISHHSSGDGSYSSLDVQISSQGTAGEGGN